MSGQRTIFILVVCFSITVFVSRSLPNSSGTQQPEYKTDFEDQQQTIPQDNPNILRDRTARRWTMPQRFGPDFTRLRDLRPEQRIREMQRMAQEQEEQAMKQALGVNEEQWKVIKTKLDKVKACREQASVNIGLPFSSNFVSTTGSQQGGGFGGGFQFQLGGGGGGSNMMTPDSSFQSQSNFQNQSNRRETQGERICRQLDALLNDINSSPEAIRLKTLELQQARANARKQLAQAQKELREALTLRQQARLVLMGILD
jgi:hypothetical protein